MEGLRIVLNVLVVAVCVATALPFIKTDQWWIRVFDFPRIQWVFFGIAILVVYAFVLRRVGSIEKGLIVLLGIALLVQFWQIFPYTALSTKQVKSTAQASAGLRILVANVLQDNRDSPTLRDIIDKSDPDVILLNEVDDWWSGEMRRFEKSHPHTIFHPRTNTYGMNLYSRFPLKDPEVRFLVEPEVPSIRTRIEMGDRTVLFYGVHPRPPALKHPVKDERQDSTERDAELVMIAKEVADLAEPVIVAGDFNDVAWSHTTRLFQRTSRLLDPRVGRGLFNTYNAKTPLFRYPLDHLFHSDHFKLVEIERLPHFGSDHFPMLVVLNLEPQAAAEQEAPPPKEADEEEVQEIMERPAKKD